MPADNAAMAEQAANLASMTATTSAAAHGSLASPNAVHPAEWTIHQVMYWLQTLQPSSVAQAHASKFREHDIEGDVLLQLDADSLRDMGITSIGHRLVLLRGIYDLKRRWNIGLEADDWRPDIASVEVRNGSSSSSSGMMLPTTMASVSTADMVRALHERDERVWLLEQEVARLVDWLMRYTDDTSTSSKTVEALQPYLPPAKPHSTLPFAVAGLAREIRSNGSSGSLQAHSNEATRDGSTSSSSGRGSKTPLTATAFRHAQESHAHSPYGAPGNVSQSGFSPTTSTPGATPTNAHPPISIPTESHKPAPLTSSTLMPGIAGGLISASSAGSGAQNVPASNAAQSTNLGIGTAATLSPSSPFSMTGGDGKKDKGANGDTPYKSFRVTLDDPCYKVLPAALKKYKINDDWRQYALFICYGSTERCLSYDEKPLLLFQKLKENKQSPVFMLRHIRDVKSPIAIANAKAAARKSAIADGSAKASASSSPTAQRSGVSLVAEAVAKFGGTSGKDGGAEGDGGQGEAGDGPFVDSMPGQPRLTGPAAQLAEGKTADGGRGAAAAASASGSDTYAIAIYPYVSEREDEFDVSVGDTFIVKSKAKGWWVVQRDTLAKGHPIVEGVMRNADGTPKNGGEIKSGWVPAGCLLETRQPLSAIVSVPQAESVARAGTPTSPKTPQAGTKMEEAQAKALAGYMANIPIPPSLITSTSTPGILLMDYKNEEEKLYLKKDQRLRVFKRYNHWSYCVEEGGGHTRAWLPSWYIGKVGGSSRNTGSGNAASRQALGSAASTGPQSRRTESAQAA